MTNEEALILLTEYREAAERAVVAATWAECSLTFGGEQTWDAVKSVSDGANHLASLGHRVERLREQHTFEAVLP